MTTPSNELRTRLGLITEEELAEMLDNKVETIRAWRSEKFGPKWTKLGKSVFYRAQDVTDWINANVVGVAA
jgi:predicted DNA-binding transcriptional regulator AlpA